MLPGAASVVELDGTCTLSREQIGGKAWSVNRMRALGLAVPPAFAITTDGWADYVARGAIAEEIWRSVRTGIAALERGTGRDLGGANPLLVSVRSGAAVSMPGMMDTVLNLGINRTVVQALTDQTENAAYAQDTHRRFTTQYREVVAGDSAAAVPEDPWEQLHAAVIAVFESWNSDRAKAYRRSRGLPDTMGTAVTVQAMVFGNLDSQSGTGVLFTRNPNTGDRAVFGEWLVGGQGEDVVSGRTTPRALADLATTMPDVHRQLVDAAVLLERDGRDIQDIEFTVESGRLWLLQARSAKRSARAAVRAAIAMADEGLISRQEAVERVSAEQVRTLLQPTAADTDGLTALARGESACPGLASGIAVTDPAEAETRAAAGEDVVLVRPTTSPDDVTGMISARAIVTELGGATSHAALVSRELGRPCVVGCGPGTVAALTGRIVTVDGDNGAVWAGTVIGNAVDDHVLEDLARLREWGWTDVPTHSFRGHGNGKCEVAALDVLAMIGIKSRVTGDALAASLSADVHKVAGWCDRFVDEGLCLTTPAGLRLTPEGRARLAELLEQERADIDSAAVGSAYTEFCEFNAELKSIVTKWQMKDAATVNDHADAEYDGQVLAQLGDLHRRCVPLLDRIDTIAGRLSHYRDRLQYAVTQIEAGDHSWVARPVIDSYHTVWFELHEDLIGLSGLRRADEAAAGRAH